MRILIIKHGALGDVVRTSYFAGALRKHYGNQLRLSWVTIPNALPLLQFNPAIDDIWTDFTECRNIRFDRVYSLDDETEIIERVMKLDAGQITGAIINSSGARDYTDDAAEWFDMGLLSRYGRERADELKKNNTRSYAEIFSDIIGVQQAQPEFWGIEPFKVDAQRLCGDATLVIGINPYAGARWPSKELPSGELKKLVTTLLTRDMSGESGGKKIILFGCGANRLRNLDLIRDLGDPRILAPDTEDSVLRLAAIINEVDYMVSSDTLALHLAIALHKSFFAFFAPTSAVEIDDFGFGVKLRSTSPDYCSYTRDADNSTITADRIFKTMTSHRPDLFGVGTSYQKIFKRIS